MTGRAPGRARGRARGRSRGTAPQEARRPGEPPPPQVTPSEQPQVGRGRGRAVSTGPPPQQPTPPQPTPQPPTDQMARMGINGDQRRPPSGPPAGVPPGRGRGPLIEPHTRPEHIQDKRGTSGTQISVVSNFIVLRNRPNHAIYQYNVSYSPQIDSKGFRRKLLFQHETVIPKVHAFDGMILYLPIRLPQDVTELVTQRDDGDPVTVTVTLTNELHASSPVCLQLFNVLFRRYMYM